MGRLYLPREALRGVGIISTDPATVLANPMLAEACVILVELAKGHFRQAERHHGAGAAAHRAGAADHG